MSRTQKDVVSYFPHDANASAGDTLTALEGQFGNDGYAFWFKLLEKLASTEGHYLDCNNSRRWQLLLARMGINDTTGVDILNLLVEMGAIDKELWDQRMVWCQKLVDNVADVYRNRRRAIPQKPNSTGIKLLTTPEMAINTPDNTQSKVNESKKNKNIEDKTTNSSTEHSIENVFEVYRQNIGELSQDMENRLVLAVKRFTATWVIDAIREGVKYNKKTWVYIAGILRNWEMSGKNTKQTRKSNDPDKYIKGKYGHMVKR